MKFLSDILAKAGLTVDGVVTLNNTATGQTPDANDNSTKLATTAWVRTFVQPYSLPIASASVLGGIKVGAGLSINPSTGVLSASAAGISTRDVCTFTATAGQTTFSCSYTVDQVDVFYNGSKLGASDFTATNGTTVVLNTACKVGDYLEIVSWVAGAGLSSSRTITINGVTYDLTANRTWTTLPTGGAAGDILAKVDGTDYNTTWIPNFTSTVQHTVKAGVALTKGQAVYVSSADGTNMIVSKASNASEQTSSKTLGLVAQNLAINGQGFVVTEGLLAGLNTNGANAGDPVWLGTDGNLIFGLLNKPTAPAHLVFIGVVTRVQQNNGEIFVKVQNGFELDELHDLSVKNASDGDMIKYVASTGLWTKIAASTTNIVEGTNLYYTQGRFDTAFAAKSTTNLTEGTNLYYTTARANSDFDTRLATKSTTNLAEGTNLYYTDARVGTYLTNNSYATQTYVNTAVSNLVDAAPGTLDTLNELAAALGDDPNFATTVATSIGTKEPAITAGTTSQYWRGDKTWQTLPVYTLSGLGGVPTTRSLTINGTAYDLSADRSWTINSMVYPGAGIAVSTGSAWGTSITNNSTNWNTAYGWGNHASAGYLTGITSSQVTTALGFTPYNSSNPSGYISSYTETDTLNSVTTRGNTTNNVLIVDQSNDGFTFRTSASWGGWARNAFSILSGGNDRLASFGGYGSSGSSIAYAFIGTAYNDYWAAFSTDGSFNTKSNIGINDGYLYASAGSGAAYSSRLSTQYSYPLINTYLDSVAGASYSGRLHFRTTSGGGGAVTQYTMTHEGLHYMYGRDNSGTRTSPYNTLTIETDNNSNPYNGFGGAILFRNRIYSGGPTPGGIRDSARIRTSIQNNSSVNYGTDLVFETTATGDGSLVTRLTLPFTGSATFSEGLNTNGTNIIYTGNEYLRSSAVSANQPQFQTWYNSAGTRRGYFGYGSSGSNTLELNNESGGQVLFNGGDIIANGNYFRMKGEGSAEFIWYKAYSGSPSHPGFVINNRDGNTTFSHNANGGGTSVSGNFTAANLVANGSLYLPDGGRIIVNNETDTWGIRFRTTASTTQLGSSLKNIIYTGGGANEGFAIQGSGYGAAFEVRNNGATYVAGTLTAQGMITGNLTGNVTGTASAAETNTGRYRGSFTVGGNTSTFYPVAFQIGSGSTANQGISVIQIERGGYDDPGYSNYTFSTFHCRIRAKADGWGFGASYWRVEANAYTTPMLADVAQQNQTSQLIVWLRGGCAYRWYDVEGGWSVNFTNPDGGNYVTFSGNATYSPTTTNTIGATFHYQPQWGQVYYGGTITAGGDVVAYSDARVKTNLRPIENVIDRICKSRGVIYDRTDVDSNNNIGFIAQELEETFPELVTTDGDRKSVKYQNATAILFEAIKELKVENDALKETLKRNNII